MPNTPLLAIPQLSPSQTGKEVTINDAIMALEAATNASLTISFAGGVSRLLSDVQATRNFLFIGAEAAAPCTLRFPVAINEMPYQRLFSVLNTSGHPLTVKFASGEGTEVVIPNGEARLISAHKGTNMIVAAQPGTAVSFNSLSDTPGSFGGQAGKMLVVNPDENALELVPAASFPAFLNNAGKVLVVNDAGNGVEWVEVDVATAFTSLTDSPASYTDAGGKLVAVKEDASGLEFIDLPPPEAVTFRASARWRLFVITKGTTPQTGYGEVEFLDQDGHDLTGAGTASAANHQTGFEPEQAFNNSTISGTGWLTEPPFAEDIWLEYTFADPVVVRQVRLTSITDAPQFTPRRVKIQYHDGDDWVDAGDRVAAPWVNNQPQTFKVNGVGVGGLEEAPLDGRPYVRKDADWHELLVNEAEQWKVVDREGDPIAAPGAVTWSFAADGAMSDGIIVKNLDQYNEVMVLIDDVIFRIGATAQTTAPAVRVSADNGASFLAGTIYHELNSTGVKTTSTSIRGSTANAATAKSQTVSLTALQSASPLKPFESNVSRGFVVCADPIDALKISHAGTQNNYEMTNGRVIVLAR